MNGAFSAGVAVAGVGDVDYGALYKDRHPNPPRDAYALAAEAFKNALDDSGLKKEDIDGILCVRDVNNYEECCCRLGLKQPRLVNLIEGAGRMSGVSMQYAAMAIKSGMCHTVLVLYGNNGRSVGDNYGSNGSGADRFGYMHGMTSPGAQVSAMFNRYRHTYGITDEQFAKVAMSNRYHASLNPKAIMRERYSFEDYMKARYITEPLRLYDYALINDGAVAIILTTVERARDLKKPVVEMVASSCCGDMSPSYLKEDFFFEGTRKVAADVYGASGLQPKDIDALMLYDNFTPTMLFELEGLGFCDRGEAGAYIDEVGISLGSRCPVNTHGGHTSESYMQGFGHHVEAVRQVRGECGERQVPNCKVSQFVISSPIISSHIFVRR